jgi:CRISPR system Cascade subunit CasC
LAFVSPAERARAFDLAERMLADPDLHRAKEGKKLKKGEEAAPGGYAIPVGEVLQEADGAADVAMFGRMLADAPHFNRDAAVQVSHAFTTHQAIVEDDFYTAVDDLKTPAEDAGAGFVGDAGFGSGVFYLYACVDCDLLEANLGGDRELAQRSVAALVEALATATPLGKRNSFAHQVRASHIRAEWGRQQPRSLAGAFFKAITGFEHLEDDDPAQRGQPGGKPRPRAHHHQQDKDHLRASVACLQREADDLNRVYGDACDAVEVMDAPSATGSLDAIRIFAVARMAGGGDA